MPVPLISSLRYLTADLPGIGGRIKVRPEDFVVEEQALYETTGTGEHLYLFIEKRGQTTMDVVRRLAKAFHVRRGDIGYAGLKDKHAVTRQHFSIYMPDPSKDQRYLAALEHPPFSVLWAHRHGNKLRRGHLAANRFVIHIREVDASAAVTAHRVCQRLVASGIPNYFGEQRFGARQNNHHLGRMLLLGQYEQLLSAMLGEPCDDDGELMRLARSAYDRGDFGAALDHWPRHLRHDRRALDMCRQGRTAEQVVMGIDRQQRAFLINAMQSAVFNDVLRQRVETGCFDQLMDGDQAYKHDSGALFAVDAPTAAAENGPDGRVGRGAVSPTGPLWGATMPRAGGEVDRLELAALEAFGLTLGDLCDNARMTVTGGRRPLRVQLIDPQVAGGADEHGPYVRASFSLPRGSYATIVLREIMKNDTADAEDHAE